MKVHFFLLCLFIPLACSSMPKINEKKDNELKAVNVVVESFIKKAREKYGLIVTGSGLGYPKELESFELRFEIIKNIDVLGARKLMVDSSQELLGMINNNPVLRTCTNYPFSAKNLGVVICFADSAFQNKPPSSLIAVILAAGNLSYHRPESSISWNCILREPYEKALRIVQGGEQ
jgi:hypothetical protein